MPNGKPTSKHQSPEIPEENDALISEGAKAEVVKSPEEVTQKITNEIVEQEEALLVKKGELITMLHSDEVSRDAALNLLVLTGDDPRRNSVQEVLSRYSVDIAQAKGEEQQKLLADQMTDVGNALAKTPPETSHALEEIV